MKQIIQAAGLVLALAGISMADSQMILIPIAVTTAGVMIMMLGGARNVKE